MEFTALQKNGNELVRTDDWTSVIYEYRKQKDGLNNWKHKTAKVLPKSYWCRLVEKQMFNLLRFKYE